MFVESWQILFDKSSKNNQCIFVNGNIDHPQCVQLPSGADFYTTKTKTINIVWGKNFDKIKDYLVKAPQKEEILVCFSGSDSDFKKLLSVGPDIKQRDFVQLRKGCSHVINICWDHLDHLWSYCDVISSVVPKEISSSPKPAAPAPKPTPKAKKNVAVSMQKSDNDSKTNK
jgi:hypothetical protein